MTGHSHRSFLNAGLFAVSSIIAVAPGSSQETATGHLATSSVGQVGRRQDQSQAAPNAEPMVRLNNRIQNRIESRIRSRIDRDYFPSTLTLSSFKVAAARASAPTQTSGR